MAGRDPRADIVDDNPFSNVRQKIPRVHSTTSNDGTIHINFAKAKSIFNNSNPKTNETSIWHFSEIEKSTLKLATGAFTLALGFMAVRGISGV